MRWFGAAGLVMASTLAIVAQTVLLQRELTRVMPGMSFAPVWPTVRKVGIATLGMGAAVAAGWHLLRNPDAGKMRDVLALFSLIFAGAGVYALLLWQLKIEGREELSALWQKVIRKLK